MRPHLQRGERQQLSENNATKCMWAQTEKLHWHVFGNLSRRVSFLKINFGTIKLSHIFSFLLLLFSITEWWSTRCYQSGQLMPKSSASDFFLFAKRAKIKPQRPKTHTSYMIKLMDVAKCNWMGLSYSEWNEVASLEACRARPRQRLYLNH